MKTTEIVGYVREDLGTKFSKALRADGNVPAVLYGGDEVIHFHTPAYLFRDLIYTPTAYIVNLTIGKVQKRAILQDAQFHPVNESLLHADFLEIFDDKPVTMDVPVKLSGESPGVLKGGQVYVKNKKLRVRAVPANLPQEVECDINSLELGASVRVKDLDPQGYEIITKPSVSIVQIIIPRALKAAGAAGDGEEGEGEEAEEAAEA